MCRLQRRGDVFILTITGDGEHCLNPTLIDSIRDCLRRAKSESTSSAATLITTADGEFFSNGYDFAWAQSDPDQFWTKAKVMSKKLQLLVEDLISLPVPTIAAVNGHATAAGFVLALTHDYIDSQEQDWIAQDFEECGVEGGEDQCAHRVGVGNRGIRARKRGGDYGCGGAAGGGFGGKEVGWGSLPSNRRNLLASVVAALSSDKTVGDSEDQMVSRL